MFKNESAMALVRMTVVRNTNNVVGNSLFYKDLRGFQNTIFLYSKNQNGTLHTLFQ